MSRPEVGRWGDMIDWTMRSEQALLARTQRGRDDVAVTPQWVAASDKNDSKLKGSIDARSDRASSNSAHP